MIGPTDCKELMASEHSRPHSDICVGVSVDVRMHADLFVCPAFVCVRTREACQITLRLTDGNLHVHSLAYSLSCSTSASLLLSHWSDDLYNL